MQYYGGKVRIAPEIMPIVLRNRCAGQVYVEPFVGGGNTIVYADNPRIANDHYAYIVDCLQAVANGWIPPHTITEDQYEDMRAGITDSPSHLLGFASHACARSGIRWGTYVRSDSGRNYALQARKRLLRYAPDLQGIDWRRAEYTDLILPGNSLVYCDPPYAGAVFGYSHNGIRKFDSAKFWQWAENLAKSGHTVFVSEYAAPSKWQCVWEKNVQKSSSDSGNARAIEKLFTYA